MFMLTTGHYDVNVMWAMWCGCPPIVLDVGNVVWVSSHGSSPMVLYGQGQDKKILKRINKLITDTQRSPFEGIGKTEPLRENLAGFRSSRIDDSNRLVYAVDENKLTIISCRYHYEK